MRLATGDNPFLSASSARCRGRLPWPWGVSDLMQCNKCRIISPSARVRSNIANVQGAFARVCGVIARVRKTSVRKQSAFAAVQRRWRAERSTSLQVR